MCSLTIQMTVKCMKSAFEYVFMAFLIAIVWRIDMLCPQNDEKIIFTKHLA